MNIFVGENAGSRIFKVGVLSLIAIAHLTENMRDLKYSKTFQYTPFRDTDLEPVIRENLKDKPFEVDHILFNLFYAIKLVAAKVLLHIPLSGNVTTCTNGQLTRKATLPIKEY
jgi:hypothetical protein